MTDFPFLFVVAFHAGHVSLIVLVCMVIVFLFAMLSEESTPEQKKNVGHSIFAFIGIVAFAVLALFFMIQGCVTRWHGI